jgi:GNAT superfamily N-acetyltransferase
MLKITPLKEEHIEDAAALVSRSFLDLWEQVPILPRQYSQLTVLRPLLQNLMLAGQPGVAAFENGRLVGFLIGWLMPSFRGKRSTYSPEWANAACLEDSQRIYEEMYTQLAGIWKAENYLSHYISLFPNDVHALRTLSWLDFGMISVDAVRSTDPVPGGGDFNIRRAGPRDLELVMQLHEDLRQYMQTPPVFFLAEKKDRSYYEAWLQDPGKVVWLADWHSEPAAIMRLGPADDDVCAIIYDEKTTSIYAAFTREEARQGGLATALLDRALESARASGYERCAVSFEPMNVLGSRFWLKYFSPVCYSVHRQVDERLAPSSPSSQFSG